MYVQARRNAFLMLFQADAPRAVAFLTDNIEQVDKFGEGFQLAVLEIARKVCRQDPGQKSRFVRCIFELLQSDSALVSYDAASTLVALSSSPTAVRAAATTFCNLLAKHSDNNVKLIVLQRLDALRRRHTKVLQELVVDVLRALSSPNQEIRRRTLEIAIDLLSPRNIDGVMLILKKELMQSQNENEQGGSDYRALLVKAMHQCATKFPEVAGSVVMLLMEFLTGSGDGAVSVVQFVREIVQAYPNLRPEVLEKLIELLPFITNTLVVEVVLWILGEYCESVAQISSAFSAIQECLGPLPFSRHMPSSVAADPEAESSGGSSGPKLLADGTYASQSSLELAQAAVRERAAVLCASAVAGRALGKATLARGGREARAALMLLLGACVRVSSRLRPCCSRSRRCCSHRRRNRHRRLPLPPERPSWTAAIEN